MVCLVTHSVTEIIDKWTTVYLKHYILMMCVCVRMLVMLESY